jgi:signal transduction histidine kinase
MTRRAIGLRPRLAVALVATSLATLVAATATMAPLLEQRLEHERLADLRGLVRAVRPELRAVPPADLRPHSVALQQIAARLQRRAGGRIVIYDDRGRTLADTAADPADPILLDLRAERARAVTRADLVTSGEHNGRAFALSITGEDERRLTLVIGKRLDDTRAAAGVVRRVLPLGLAAGLIVGVLLALLLSRSVLRRLRRLHDDARALRDEGLGHQVTVAGSDEVAVVARALEEMRTRLVQDEGARQAFVATASHELRTPLASLQATLELLREEVREGRAEPDVLVARADTALRQTHRLVGLATDLLDLSRIDGEVELSPEPLELAEVARIVGREFAARLEGAGRTLDVTGGPALALADPAATARILRILLDNADHHGAGAVQVAVATEPAALTLTVADEGEGLPAEEAEALFVRFVRGRAAAGVPGAGLGLAIARGLARAQGGDLRADGAAWGHTAFVLTLPPWRGSG